MYDKAKAAVKTHLECEGKYTKNVENYGPDIQAILINTEDTGHLWFHEIEVKVLWEDDWPKHWETLCIPIRKRDHLNLDFGERGTFWVLNKSCTKAKVVVGHDLLNICLENIPNIKSKHGSLPAWVPIELTSEIILKNDIIN